jgi:hypothetical protein
MTDTTHAALVEAMARGMCGHDLEWRDCTTACLQAMACAGDIGAIEHDMDKARAALYALRTARPDVAALLDGEAVAVPREATTEMMNAYVRGLVEAEDPTEIGQRRASGYRAMLAASPWSKRDE